MSHLNSMTKYPAARRLDESSQLVLTLILFGFEAETLHGFKHLDYRICLIQEVFGLGRLSANCASEHSRVL